MAVTPELPGLGRPQSYEIDGDEGEILIVLSSSGSESAVIVGIIGGAEPGPRFKRPCHFLFFRKVIESANTSFLLLHFSRAELRRLPLVQASRQSGRD